MLRWLLEQLSSRRPPPQQEARPAGRYICCVPVRWGSEHGEYDSWFHLYEDEDGTRAFRYVPNVNETVPKGLTPLDLAMRHYVYNEAILPWMEHMFSNEAVQAYSLDEAEDDEPEEADTSFKETTFGDWLAFFSRSTTRTTPTAAPERPKPFDDGKIIYLNGKPKDK